MAENLNLWDYLEQREEEIVHMRAELLRELEALRETRASLESRTREISASPPRTEKLTIKEMIRSVLERNPEGGTSDQIINWINVIHGNEIARTSLSPPQLSRLKADGGEVNLNEKNGLWSLVRFLPFMAAYLRQPATLVAWSHGSA